MENVGQQEIKNSRAHTLKGRGEKRKVDIAFQQTDCTCHHEKPLLIAKQHGGRVGAPWFRLADAAAC